MQGLRSAAGRLGQGHSQWAAARPCQAAEGLAMHGLPLAHEPRLLSRCLGVSMVLQPACLQQVGPHACTPVPDYRLLCAVSMITLPLRKPLLCL